MKSKTLVYTVAGIIVLVDVIVMELSLVQDAPSGLGSQVVRLFLTCLLSYSLIRGWNPARWIAIVLLGIAGLSAFVFGLILISETLYGLAIVALGLIYAGCAYSLTSRKAKRHFRR